MQRLRIVNNGSANKNSLLLFGGIICVAGAVFGISYILNADQRAIDAVSDAVCEAAQAGDVGGIVEHLDPDGDYFRRSGTDGAESWIRTSLANVVHSTITYRIDECTIDDGTAALVVTASAVPKGIKQTENPYRVRVVLDITMSEKEEGGWWISKVVESSRGNGSLLP